MRPSPFALIAHSPFGDLRVEILPGRCVRVTAAPPGSGAGDGGAFRLAHGDLRFALKARISHDGTAWVLRELGLLPERAAPPAATRAIGALLVEGLAPALDGCRARLVERDIVEIHRERLREAEGIERVRAEIDRRRAKLRSMARAARRAGRDRDAREGLLRAELAGCAPPAPVTPPHAAPAA